MLRGLVVIGGLAVVAGVAAELAAPGIVEAGIEQTVRERTGDTTQVEARAEGSPFLPRLLLDGVVEQVEVSLAEVAGYELTTATVSLRGDGIRLDRSAMYRGNVEITDLDTGTVTIAFHEDELSDLLGAPVDLDAEAVGLAGSALEVAGQRALDVPVDSELMPCTPRVDVDPPHLRLTCTFEGVPGVLETIVEE